MERVNIKHITKDSFKYYMFKSSSIRQECAYYNFEFDDRNGVMYIIDSRWNT